MANSWSGIVVKSDTGNGIASVSGQWTVPQVNRAALGDSSCYVWIGIDGYGDGYPYVLQAGISLDVKGGRLSMNAWWEWTPDPVQPILPIGSFTVLPGDLIWCKIEGQLGSNTATITLQNRRTNQVANFPNPVRARRGVVLRGNYGEWIVEAPIENNSQATLCDYGQVQFSECSAFDANQTPIDPLKGTPLTFEQNGHTSTGSSPGSGQVTCAYGPVTNGALAQPNIIRSRVLPPQNAISSQSP
jgi:peptidase A4-like protein